MSVLSFDLPSQLFLFIALQLLEPLYVPLRHFIVYKPYKQCYDFQLFIILQHIFLSVTSLTVVTIINKVCNTSIIVVIFNIRVFIGVVAIILLSVIST